MCLYGQQSQELLVAANTEEEVALDTASEAGELQRAIQEHQSSIRGWFITLLAMYANNSSNNYLYRTLCHCKIFCD